MGPSLYVCPKMHLQCCLMAHFTVQEDGVKISFEVRKIVRVIDNTLGSTDIYVYVKMYVQCLTLKQSYGGNVEGTVVCGFYKINGSKLSPSFWEKLHINLVKKGPKCGTSMWPRWPMLQMVS